MEEIVGKKPLFTPANMANLLRARGHAIARRKIAKRQAGLHVFTAGGVMLIEWVDFPDAHVESRLMEAVATMKGLGYEVISIEEGMLYRINERPDQ
jgi:hypothetical protein